MDPKTIFNYDHYKLEKITQIKENKKNLKAVTQLLKTNYALPPINYRLKKNINQNNKNQPNEFLNPQKKKSEKNNMASTNKIISIKQIENKSSKSNKEAPYNKNKIDLEKKSTKKQPKMVDKPNKINIDNNFKISKVQNKQENNGNINLYINSINELRLPKEFKDISFDNPKNK